MHTNQLRKVFSIAIVIMISLSACKTKDVNDEAQKREFARRLQEAQELARQIREGSLFDEEQIKSQKVQEPGNVCCFTANYIACDFGADPQFRGNGRAALYNDTSGVIYYYDIDGKQRYKMFQYGQHSSFGMFFPDGRQKYIFQEYDRVKTDEGYEQKILGIRMNSEKDWLKPAKNIYNGPASYPFLVNDDRTVIFIEDGKYYQLDENLEKQQITEQEYISLRDSRFEMKNQWKIFEQYKGIKGLWVTDLAERNWVQLRDLKELKTVAVLPSLYAIYCWGPEFAGLLEIIPADLPNFSVKLNEGMGADVGDLFDIYEKELSPISQEVIGYKKDVYKGTLRVIRIVQGLLICEFQTKIYLSGVFKDDAAVSQKNPEIIGAIL
ncbi:hypothetical protein JW823_06810 [bacterium]|nr:hypothetical protein [candidate division CSSED10-310 bacterium]